MTAETIVIEKELFNSMINDIEILIDDIENIMEKNSTKEISKRLNDIKKNKVKGFSEKDLDNYVKKRAQMTPDYELRFHPDFFKDLDKLDKKDVDVVYKQIKKIKQDPTRFKHLTGAKISTG